MTTMRPAPPAGARASGSFGRCGPSSYEYQPRPVLRPRLPAATICAWSMLGFQRGSPKLWRVNDWATS